MNASNDIRHRSLNERQAAEVLNVSVKTLQKWRCSGHGPKFMKLGAAVRYRLTDVEDFMERALRQ